MLLLYRKALSLLGYGGMQLTSDERRAGLAAALEALPFPPRMVNLKPSRLGGLKRLCDTYDYCAAHGVDAYGGGQFELGPGRGQAQYLAALFHADTPNDLAPTGFNEPEPPPGLPTSPLPVAAHAVGFGWNSA